MTDLKKRWRELSGRLGAKDISCDALLAAYAEPQRHYHTLIHLQDVLGKLDMAKELLEKSGEVAHLSAPEKQKMFDAIELALWYHDAVYDATRKDNEDKSAEWLLKDMGKLDIASEAAALVRMTAHHGKAATLAEKILSDCDLAILGADDAAFRKYDADIRKEYAHVPAPLYKAGRHKVLKGFLDQKDIFKTSAFKEMFDDKARRNLAAATSSPLRRFLGKFAP